MVSIAATAVGSPFFFSTASDSRLTAACRSDLVSVGRFWSRLLSRD